MNKIISVVSALVLSSTLVFGVFGNSPVKAENAISKNEVVSAHSFVPEEYFLEYKGKFSSYEEAAKAAGFSLEKKSYTSENGTIDVQSVDEFAATLFYINDTASTSRLTPSSTKVSRSALTASDTYNVTHEETWNDAGIWWMKAYVYATYDRSTSKIVGTPQTGSGLYGIHPGNSWEHDQIKSDHSVRLNSTRTGGSARISGTLTLDFGWEIATKELFCDMNF